jgi:hypothetical protein
MFAALAVRGAGGCGADLGLDFVDIGVAGFIAACATAGSTSGTVA